MASLVKCDLGGQRSCFEKAAQLIKDDCWKKISDMVEEWNPLKDLIVASQVKIDLGGQRSYFEKVVCLTKDLHWNSSGVIRGLKFSVWP